MAAAVRALGIVQRLRAEDAGAVVPPVYAGDLDPAIKVRNASEIRGYNSGLRTGLGNCRPGYNSAGSGRRLQTRLFRSALALL